MVCPDQHSAERHGYHPNPSALGNGGEPAPRLGRTGVRPGGIEWRFCRDLPAAVVVCTEARDRLQREARSDCAGGFGNPWRCGGCRTCRPCQGHPSGCRLGHRAAGVGGGAAGEVWAGTGQGAAARQVRNGRPRRWLDAGGKGSDRRANGRDILAHAWTRAAGHCRTDSGCGGGGGAGEGAGEGASCTDNRSRTTTVARPEPRSASDVVIGFPKACAARSTTVDQIGTGTDGAVRGGDDC